MHDLIRRAEAALTANPFSPQAGLIQDLLAALKAQQPSSAGQTGPQVAQGDNGGRGFVIKNLQATTSWVGGGGGGKAQQPAQDHDCALKRGAAMCRDCDLDVIEKAAPVDAEGLPPLPEPYIRIPNNGRGPMQVMEPFYSADQLRQAQREAQAVERERWMKLCKDAAQRYFSGGFGEAAGACTHLHAQGSAIRQGTKT